ncbi:FG-GAP-like repeat-containing protein [Dapis sp. BLCC M229]|uniref:FG-GAP-like repeat-containing protein n=1 Tax=Dapis sp. BLCC M229 TaxID=3400188 RepID=UPI003CF97786
MTDYPYEKHSEGSSDYRFYDYGRIDMEEEGVNTFDNSYKYIGLGTEDHWWGTESFEQWKYYSKIMGTTDDNTIQGNGDFSNSDFGGRGDWIYGRGGNDEIWGYEGDDTVDAGSGNDVVVGGDGDDLLAGKDGNDQLRGDNGNDILRGGNDHDVLYTGSLADGASDVLSGEHGTDTFILGDSTLQQSDVVTGEGIDWGNLALSLAGDVTDLGFTIVPGLGTVGKIAKEFVPMVFDVAKAISNDGESVGAPVEGKTGSATIEDFNPTEDVIYIPLPLDGDIYLDQNSNGNNLLKVMHDTNSTDVIATVQLSNELNSLEGYSSGELQRDWFSIIERQALIIDSNDAKDYKTNTKLNIADEDLENLGTNKFLVLGAYSEVQIGGNNGANYMYGTQLNDVIAGYETESAVATAGNDVMYGFEGNDEFSGGQGSDRIYGGDGSDTANYIHSTGGINVNISQNTVNDGFGTTDTLDSIENIIGSSHKDTVTFKGAGTAVNPKIYSLDVSSEKPASDETGIFIGIEEFIGSDATNDTIDFSSLNGPLTVTVNKTGTAEVLDESTNETYTVKDFERFIGSKSSNDRFEINDPGISLDDYSLESFELKGATTAVRLAQQNGYETTGQLPGKVIHTGNTTYIGWSSQDQYPRMVADFNRDGKDDIIGFAQRVATIQYSRGDGTFTSYNTLNNTGAFSFGTLGSQNDYPRAVGDINGDGYADIVAFRENDILVAENIADPTLPAPEMFPAENIKVVDNLSLTRNKGGWVTQDRFPRMLGDVNNDGFDDIIGFGAGDVFVALSNGDGTFADHIVGMRGDFTVADGYTSQNEYPRFVGDINKDGNVDIVGINGNQIRYAYGQNDGTFSKPYIWDDQYNYMSKSQGWDNQNIYRRALADINGDGKADIIGFNPDDNQMYVSFATRDRVQFGSLQSKSGFDAPVPMDNITDAHLVNSFGAAWDQYHAPRMLGDIDGNGQADILGFGGAGLYANIWEGAADI